MPPLLINLPLVLFQWCRTEGGIPPLVRLLESTDAKVQRAAAGALRTLAFKNEANKNQVKFLIPDRLCFTIVLYCNVRQFLLLILD